MSRLITHAGERHCIADWARLLDVNENTLRQRINRGNMSDFEKYVARPDADGERQKTLEDYIKEKIDILENDFYFRLTIQELSNIKRSKNIEEVDRHAFDIIRKKL